MESILTWLSTWTTDQVITTFVKSHAIVTGVLIVAVRTIAGRTKTTIDNEFLGRIRKRFGMDKSND